MKTKTIYLMVVLGLAAASVSCRVNAPLDPATMKPSCKCCPQHYKAAHPSSCQDCACAPNVSSK